jgi:RHS repeat-associated protein
VVSFADDGWGQVTAVCVGADARGGASADCLRYSTTSYDPAYAQLPIEQQVATDRRAGTPTFLRTRIDSFDRGLGLALAQRDENGVLTESGVDGLGRPTWVRRAGRSGCAAATPDVRVRYAVTDDAERRPVSFVETRQERACEDGSDTAVARTFTDGLGRTRAILVATDAPHAWQRSGVVSFDARGAVARSFQPDFVDVAEPSLAAVLAPPSTASELSSYDAFDRPRCTVHADGSSLTCTSYHALSRDVCDPDDHREGTRFHGTCTTTRDDGHGRTVDTILRNVTPEGAAEIHRLWPSYRADGAVVALVRAQTVNDAPRERSRIVEGRSLARTFAHDSLGRRIAASDADVDARRPGAGAGERTHRYLYNRAGDLVAVRDPRGCGRNLFYDLAGRVIGEQYVGCAAAQRGEPPAATVPAGSIALTALDAATAVDARTYHDVYPDWAEGELAPPDAAAGALGKVTASLDRAQRSVLAYDGRGNPIGSARQLALVSAAPEAAASSAEPPVLGGGAALPAVVYDELHTYAVAHEHDRADRVRTVHYPSDPDHPDAAEAPRISGRLDYDRRGLPTSSSIDIDAVGHPVVTSTRYAADGLVEEIVYGDGASDRQPTTSRTSYDVRRRPRHTQVVRTPSAEPDPDNARTLAQVGAIVDQEYGWDPASNLIAIRDLRPASEHPDGARPRSTLIDHDALYRVVDVGYEYETDGGTAPFDAASDWRDAAERLRAADPMAQAPAPSVASLPEGRAVSMTWSYDFLGSASDWDDDASAFHERSLGVISHGRQEPGGRPSALRFASNLPGAAPAPDGVDRGGYLEVSYGEGGNVEAMRVHGQCFDAAQELCFDERARPIDERAALLAERCACQVEQHYQYGWDELNRIVEARRYDRDGAAWNLAARLRYRYDGANQRLIKQALADGDERIALYVLPGDFERRGLVRDAEGYRAAPSGAAETQYLIAGARLVWQAGAALPGLDPDHRITTSVGDLLGTTQAVIDLRSGELLELGTYYANGARESLRSTDAASVPLEPLGFTGKEADADVGLTYFGERYLLAHLGRWASPDPLQIERAGGGEALNNYHYVGGQLLQARDPIGLDPEVAGETLLDNDPQPGWTWIAEPANADHAYGPAEFVLYDEAGESTGNKVEGYYFPQLGFGLARTGGQHYAASAGKRWERISGTQYGRLQNVASCMSRPSCVEFWKSYDQMVGTVNAVAMVYASGAALAVPGAGLALGAADVIDACKDGLSWSCGGAIALAGVDAAGGVGRLGNGSRASAGASATAGGAGHSLIPSGSGGAAGGGGRIFWSGGRGSKNAAERYAKRTGGTTLEMTTQGRALEAANLPWSSAKPLWENASRQFAETASGQINVFVGRVPRPDSIWRSIEKPALQRNPAVTGIRVHLSVVP